MDSGHEERIREVKVVRRKHPFVIHGENCRKKVPG